MSCTPDNFSDAPSASTYMSSVLQSGRTSADQHSAASSSDMQSSHPESDYHHTATSEFSEVPAMSSQPMSDRAGENVEVTKTGRVKRISESTAKYIKWPLPEVTFAPSLYFTLIFHFHVSYFFKLCFSCLMYCFLIFLSFLCLLA